MKRGETGRYEATAAGEEAVRAYVPAPLPPTPPVAPEAGLERALEAAVLAVGRLDGVATLLPDKALFLYHRKRWDSRRRGGPSWIRTRGEGEKEEGFQLVANAD